MRLISVSLPMVLIRAWRRRKELYVFAFASIVQLFGYLLDYRVERVDEVHDESGHLPFLD